MLALWKEPRIFKSNRVKITSSQNKIVSSHLKEELLNPTMTWSYNESIEFFALSGSPEVNTTKGDHGFSHDTPFVLPVKNDSQNLKLNAFLLKEFP